MKGQFYFVATPIGNLEDITFRAISTLRNVDYILCEDTRHSKILLNHYEISKPLLAFHKFNYVSVTPKYIELLNNGKNLALITDAGMPSVCDPGVEIIKSLKENEINYTIIPGASAGISAYVLSGFNNASYCFCGFLPEKKKQQFIQKFAKLDIPLVFYSAVFDIDETFIELKKALGDRKVFVARELTKKFETLYETTLNNGYTGEQKGEFVLVVEGASKKEFNTTVLEDLELLMKSGYTKKEAISIVSKERDLPKNEVYKIAIDL